jgi:hypothetical protein
MILPDDFIQRARAQSVRQRSVLAQLLALVIGQGIISKKVGHAQQIGAPRNICSNPGETYPVAGLCEFDLSARFQAIRCNIWMSEIGWEAAVGHLRHRC